MRRWFDQNVLPTFADRVLPFDDALIAAVAQSAEMTVATRNTKHSEPLAVACLNPWDTNPPSAD